MSNTLNKPYNPLSHAFTLNLASLKAIQSKICSLKPDLHQNELVPEFQQLIQLLDNLNASSSNFDEEFADSSVKTFFFSEFIPRIGKKIIKYKYAENHIEMLIDCLKQMFKLEIKVLSQGEPHLRQAVLDEMLDFGLKCCKFNSYSRPWSTASLSQKINLAKDKADQNTTNVRSAFFANLCRELLDKSMFEFLYETLSSKTFQPSLKMITLICSIVSNLSYTESIPQDFVMEYACKIGEAIREKFSHHPELYTEAFTQKSLKTTLKAFRLLFKRSSSSIQQTHKAFDTLKLQISIICLDSRMIEDHFLGLQIVDCVIAEYQDPKSSGLKTLSEPACEGLFYEVFRKVYESDYIRRRLIRKSMNLLSFMLTRHLLKPDGFKFLWASLRELSHLGDCDLFKNIFDKVLRYIPFQDFLKSSLSYDINNINFKDLQTLEYIERRFSKFESVIQELTSLYWKLLENSGDSMNYTVSLDTVLYRYKRLAKDMRGDLEMVEIWISSLEKDASKFVFFRILMLHTTQIKDPTIVAMVKIIYKEKGLWDIFAKHVKSFKKSLLDQNGQTSNSIDLFNSVTPPPDKSVYIKEISQNIKFFDHLLQNQPPGESWLTYDILVDIWDTFLFVKPHASEERDIFFQTFRTVKNSIQPEHLTKFFREEINAREDAHYYLASSVKGIYCFQRCFFTLSRYLGKLKWKGSGPTPVYVLEALPEKQEGFNEAWNILMLCKEEKTTEVMKDFLIDLYVNLSGRFEPELTSIRESYLDKCFTYLQESHTNNRLKALKIISSMLNESEKYGIGTLVTHSQIQKLDFICLKIDATNLGKSSNLEILIYSGKTVFDLLKEAAQLLKVCWDEITCFKSDLCKYINWTENGKTLHEIGLKNQQHLIVIQRTIPKGDLLFKNNSLNPKAEKIFTQFFEEYSDNGMMSPEQCAAFLNSCTSNCPRPNYDQRVKNIFLLHDSDKVGYLTRKNFLDFYIKTYKENPDQVWLDLSKHNQRNDFNDSVQVNSKKATESHLVASILSNDPPKIKLLMSLLGSEDKLASETWKILCRLPTDPELFRDILVLKGVRGKCISSERNWNALFDLNSKYKLLYALYIIEYLMCSSKSLIIIKMNKELEEYSRTWIVDFIQYGGLTHLGGIFNLFKPQVNLVASEPYKRVLCFIRNMRERLSAQDLASDLKDFTVNVGEFIRLSDLYERDFKAMEEMKKIFARPVIEFPEDLLKLTE